jgi:hypothetical protein
MNIKSLLEKEHSKSITNEIVNSILSGKSDVSELMNCFFSDNHRLCQRAA